MSKLRVMDQRKGDKTLEWDPTAKDSTLVAEAEFNKIMQAGGFMAFMVTPGETRRTGEQIKEFDPSAEEILIMPALQGG